MLNWGIKKFLKSRGFNWHSKIRIQIPALLHRRFLVAKTDNFSLQTPNNMFVKQFEINTRMITTSCSVESKEGNNEIIVSRLINHTSPKLQESKELVIANYRRFCSKVFF